MEHPRNILIVGASGGIGSALSATAQTRFPAASLVAWSRSKPASLPDSVAWSSVDVLDEAAIAAGASTLSDLDLIIVATGVLQRESPGVRQIKPEKTWRTVDAAVMAEVFAVNTIAPALIAKHVLPKFARERRAVFAALSARVGSISDNRLGGWYSYRASKAALNQIIRTLSIELAVRYPHAICVALHPGTVATGLSKPFQSNVAQEKLFTPDVSAGHLLDVVASLTPADTGLVFDWSGKVVQP